MITKKSDLKQFNNFYLVGIKGVAMTALAECLQDMGKNVRGADVAEDFVTAEQLGAAHFKIDHDFTHQLPLETEVVIYSGAHGGRTNPLVRSALEKKLLVYSHAQAQAEFFNSQHGWAICGANGKSTVSAMLAFILNYLHLPSNYSVGVGKIKGLARTGAYQSSASDAIFIAEADEYAEDVTQIDPKVGLKQARFSYLKPQLIVANNLSWDHPDVYRDLNHTQEIFGHFFLNLKTQGLLIANHDDSQLWPVIKKTLIARPDLKLFTFGKHQDADLRLISTRIDSGRSLSILEWHSSKLELILQVPGQFNIMNALAALTACLAAGLSANAVLAALAEFASTQRRFENLGEINDVLYIDDYAHHPDEIKAAIAAAREWFPQRRLVVGFQSHTYTRTLSLFTDFVDSFTAADLLVMTDIFPSARESAALADRVSSSDLCREINRKYPYLKAQNLHTNTHLAAWCRQQLQSGDIFLSLGAGDIYHFFNEMVSS